MALEWDGTLWSWGNNWAGQLGDGTTNYSRVPVRVGSSTNWTRIWANLIENVGQQTDGSLWFWGWDYTRSQRGSSIPLPTRVSLDTNWVDVGMGDWMVVLLRSACVAAKSRTAAGFRLFRVAGRKKLGGSGN